MARTVLTTITPFDYKDLKQTYSEKNIINQTSGDEFVIDLASTRSITDVNDKPAEVSIVPFSGSYTLGASYMSATIRGIFAKQHMQCRDEYMRVYVSCSIETDEIIVDTKNIAVGMTIYYDKYHANGDYVTGSNMSSSSSVYRQIMTDGNKQNSDLLAASEKLPYEHSTMEGRHIAWTDRWNSGDSIGGAFPSNSLTVRCQKLANDHFKITVSGWVCTWWGYNYTKADKWAQRANNATLLVARKLAFNISANIVEEREIEFTYARDDEKDYGNAKGKNYEIESNEFMQTDENLGDSQRQSYKTSKQIFDAFDQDRTIITFTLLNCEKYLIDGNYRFLKAEDYIYVQDENGELISDEINANGDLVPSVFEIIKTRPIWDGTFSMEVVCKKVDMTT